MCWRFPCFLLNLVRDAIVQQPSANSPSAQSQPLIGGGTGRARSEGEAGGGGGDSADGHGSRCGAAMFLAGPRSH